MKKVEVKVKVEQREDFINSLLVDFACARRYHTKAQERRFGKIDRRKSRVNEAQTLLYSDFNCPFCYAMHERLHELNLISRCEWRGVQHAPQLPRPMKPWQGMLGAELRHEVTVVQRLAPGLPISLPPGKPNTKPAIEQASALLRRDRGQGMVFVRETYRAFWCEGKDISDPVVLRQLAEQTGASAENIGAVDDKSRQVGQEWESAWHRTGQAGVPLMVSPEGDLLVGCVSPDQVLRFFA